MSAYRCFLFNDANHIIGVEAGGFESDEPARRWAAGFLGKWEAPRIELWAGPRRVAVLASSGDSDGGEGAPDDPLPTA